MQPSPSADTSSSPSCLVASVTQELCAAFRQLRAGRSRLLGRHRPDWIARAGSAIHEEPDSLHTVEVLGDEDVVGVW
jgi:hypothetical protein